MTSTPRRIDRRSHFLPCRLVVALAFAWPLSASAQTGEELLGLSLEDLGRVRVALATGTPQPLAVAPAVASVITAAELEAMGAQSVEDALETVPGLHVSRGSLFYAPRFFIRGIASSYNPQTLILVNGVPLTSLSVGDRIGLQQWLPEVETVERIEIIRGPGSALHGADAFAGVINILTREPAGVAGNRVHLATGSFNTHRASWLGGLTLGEAQGALFLAYTGTDGHGAIIDADAQSGVDSFGLAPPASRAPGPVNLQGKRFQARFDLAWREVVAHVAVGRVWDLGTGQGLADALDPQGRWTNDLGLADLSWTPAPKGDWELEGKLSYLYSSVHTDGLDRLFPPGADLGAGAFPEGVLAHSGFREQNARVSVAASYRGWLDHAVRVGGGFYWGDLFESQERANFDLSTGVPAPLPGGLTDVSDTAAVFQPEAQRTSRYLFVQDAWTLTPAWTLTAGLRHDHYSDVGETTNPRLALVWAATPTFNAKLLYGRAFRPPAFTELYAVNNPAFLGNPALAPERLSSTELAFSLTPSPAWTWDLNVYRLRIRDYIDFVANPSGTSMAQNVGRLRGHGVETEVRWQVAAPVQLRASYSVQDTEDEATGEPLGLAPHSQAIVRALWTPDPRWQVSGQLARVGQRERQAGDSRPDLDGYTALDLTVRWLRPGMTVALVGRNLGDADVREPGRGPGPGQVAPAFPHDLPQAGRGVMVEVSADW